jgi:hypothetical protein
MFKGAWTQFQHKFIVLLFFNKKQTINEEHPPEPTTITTKGIEDVRWQHTLA